MCLRRYVSEPLPELAGVRKSLARMSARLRYQAFISYSHTGDSKLARALQSSLQRFARPWYRLAPLVRVFRDETSLAADPDLWASIERHLGQSEWLLLMASPLSANSFWVNREVVWWLKHRGVASMLLLVTDGDIAWDHSKSDFDWSRTTALGQELSGKFTEEPLYLDLRWTRTLDQYSLSDARFRAAILDIMAPLLGRPKDDIDSDDIRQFRNFRLARNAAVGAICIALAGAVWQWREAVMERNEADRQRAEAQSQRQEAQEQRDRAEKAAADERKARLLAEERRKQAVSASLASVSISLRR